MFTVVRIKPEPNMHKVLPIIFSSSTSQNLFLFYSHIIRPSKVDLQFIVRAFPKMHAGGRSFFIFQY